MTNFICFFAVNSYIYDANSNNTYFSVKPAAPNESEKAEISSLSKNIWPHHVYREKLLWTLS